MRLSHLVGSKQIRGPRASLPILSLMFALLNTTVPAAHAQLEELVARVKQAIVLVEFRDVFGHQGHGSGFIYDPSGYILTNHHVIEGTIDISVKLPGGRSFPARVIDYLRRETYSGSGLQSDIDVAVLKIDGVNLPTLVLEAASDTLREGQDLLVFGYPGGVATDQISVTRGIVSAVRPGWIQTDAAIEPGNSGGPAVDSRGKVVGLATFVTGRFRKIGGVVATSNIQDFARSALIQSAPRREEVSLPGMEYVFPNKLPKRRTWRTNYAPGHTRAQPYLRENEISMADIQELHGAYAFTMHDSRGDDFRYYVDSDGLLQITRLSSEWSYSFPSPLLVFPLPATVGRSWDGTWSGENSVQGIRYRIQTVTRIDADNEVVTIPAGTFAHVIKTVVLDQRVVARGSQSSLLHVTTVVWRAPNVGPIRTVTDITETGEHLVEELISTQ